MAARGVFLGVVAITAVALAAGLAAATPVEKAAALMQNDARVSKVVALTFDPASAEDDLACADFQEYISPGDPYILAYYIKNTCFSEPYILGNYTIQSVNDDSYTVQYGANLCETDATDDTYYSYESKSYEDSFLHQNEWKQSKPYASYFPKVVVWCDNLLFNCEIQGRVCLGVSPTSARLAAD